ncbi:hypothetical protein C1645_835347 [Glomus cerebriforme]|uniref:Uncharacterized protein n=1 Tax=Glomus cerebriforme TaxID=658196 RepID=A0A397SIV5_9GLOM|nr:hypothetical protein C1645_835347 [Glomus cerebriforme]
MELSRMKYKILIKFLENNEKNLKGLYVNLDYIHNEISLNLIIAKFCPNLRKLVSGIGYVGKIFI